MQIVSLVLFILSIWLLTTPSISLAVCPICTVAVGAGLGISRAFGIDDAVTSVWIGGLILSMSFWSLDFLGKKKYKFLNKISFKTLSIIVIVLMYLLVLIPLWYGGYIGRPINTYLGIDKIIFGTVIGSIAFQLGKVLDEMIRKMKGKILFPYQKVVFPVSLLLLSSLVLHFVVA